MRQFARIAVFLVSLSPFASAARVISVSMGGVIHPITVEIFNHALDKARRENASLVLIRLNTPGGMLDATRQLIEKIDASPVPVVTFVTPSGGRAASAGFFILEAGDFAAMSFGTNTGAASPVLLNGEMDAVMRKKVENDAAASLRSQTTKRGRNAEAAEKAVRDAKSFSEGEALSDRLIDLVVRDEAELLRKLNGREITRFDGSKVTLHLDAPEVVSYEPTMREGLMSRLSDPNIAFIVLILGALGIYAEFSSPGMIAPGVFGAIFALLGLSAFSVLPINLMGAGLIGLGLVFFVLEAKFTSHGVLGTGGVVALVLGALFLVDGPPELRIHLSTALSVALPFGLITAFLMTLVARARSAKVVTGTQGMIGETGVCVTELAPRGKVKLRGVYWDAVSASPVPAGARVRVVAFDGMEPKVELVL